ncbi:NYN domain-containing protein [Amycolatopsis sp. cmx-4-68]|uniref:LabA-like NYN domain-containing protein n=1 Tax=Amycolatopsis sp. cmx-4-68 TaxID=2790938 RepID=UPI00397B3076
MIFSYKVDSTAVVVLVWSNCQPSPRQTVTRSISQATYDNTPVPVDAGQPGANGHLANERSSPTVREAGNNPTCPSVVLAEAAEGDVLHMPTMKVLVLVDEANMAGAAKTLRRRVDWEALRDVLANPQEGRQLIEMVMYVGLPPSNDEFKQQRESKLRWVRSLEFRGFVVVTKEGTPTHADGRSGYKANVDVLMAIDAMDLALSIHPDLVVLVTGDSDFAHLSTQLRRRGIRVEIASVPNSLSDTLKRSANGILDLTEVINDFQPLSGGQAPPIGGLDIFDSE